MLFVDNLKGMLTHTSSPKVSVNDASAALEQWLSKPHKSLQASMITVFRKHVFSDWSAFVGRRLRTLCPNFVESVPYALANL